MDLRHLRYFLCVAEEMHFGRAANRLGISQPPLSQQIRALEEELGVRLFDRTSRRVCLTEAGQLFEPQARLTLQQAERAVQTARLAQRGEIGHLGLGFPSSGPFVPSIASALYRFRQSHPNVELTLQELGRDAQIEQVKDRHLDIGLVRGFERPVLPDGMVSHCLLEEDMVLTIRADHPLAQRKADPCIADLAGHPLVLYGPVNGAGFNEHFIGLCEQAGFAPNVAYQASSLSTLLGLVAAGFGATVLARSLARLHVDNLVFRPFAAPVTSRLWLIHNQELSPTAQKFKATVLDENRKQTQAAG
ncbi:LysR substrate-binding domain-containing protein [Pedomonas mirosovicensis]|uniref:LysR substrate-binding domain-containing protein n=1 Tax=Pedomonas mirosovicensis TaxID=2908641 RepID=UPI00216A1459|nr:LysR substrate-binding domain-containing protein [Pedomonas mirosovicensis]MCH8686543.1 LysR substrate-binding domain-containing protein [Pedomonas mirosovicensis]